MASMFLFALVVLSILDVSMLQQCSTSNDLGNAECVFFSEFYDDYQYATCLTDEYIMRVSNQRHQCRDRTRQICWYQCMLEFYGAESGTVNDDCRCRPGETVTEAPTDVLPPHCYSPRGDDCSWYRQCLEVRYPCEGTEDGYAIEYAEKFCNLYSDNYNDFSPSGRAWVDGVRKCLQVSLVPSLRPWVARTKSCADIRREAFDGHPDCYTNPAPGVPGICELSCPDVWRSFWLVSFEGGALVSAPVETGRQMLHVMTDCFLNGPLTGCIPLVQTTLILTLPYVPPRLRAIAATRVMRRVANSLNWLENGFRWFSFTDDDNDDNINGIDQNRKKRQVSEEFTRITTLLVDAKALNISNGTMPNQGDKTLDEAVEDLATATRDGLLSKISVDVNGTQMEFAVMSVGQCADKTDALCNSTNVTELAIAPPSSGAVRMFLTPFHYLIAILCLMLSVALLGK